jgi:hypothetical protein
MLLLIIEGLHPQFFFLFSSEGAIWFTHHQYFWKVGHSWTQKSWRASLPPNQSMFPLCHPPFTSYIHGTWTMAKQYGIKKWHAIGNILRNRLKTWGTFWEQLGNLLVTKKQKKNPSPKPKRKKLSPFEHSHWLHEISISKTICHHLQPCLIPSL